MREIKFRIWDKDNKEMLDVQELDYEGSYNGQPMVRPKKYSDYYDTEDMILMQYIGLKDKKEIEMYEGDIVLTKDGRKAIIEYSDVYASYFLDYIGWCETELIDDTMELEVIGNIYDNPDLLNECDKKKYKKYRFKTKATEDYRPLLDMRNIQCPWWCSGEGTDYVIIICYLPIEEDLFKYWDDAYDIDEEECDEITYTSRFPKPDWI